MNRTACCVLVLCCLARPAAAAPAAAEVVTRIEWPGSLDVRCEVPLGAGVLLLRCDAGPDGPVRLAAGLDNRWVCAGPLVFAGLLRVAARPLGFGPGSDVSDEATGLRLDGSLSETRGLGVQVALVPETLSLFWLHPDREQGILGCTVGTAAGPIVLDAAAALSGPGTGVPGQGWFRDSAPRPAGLVLHGASRMGVSMPGLTATVMGGVSAAERAPPGWFVLGTAAVGRSDAGIDLAAAVASSGYLELGGGDAPGGLQAGARLRLAAPGARIQARYVMSVGVPGFVPGPYLHSVEELAFGVARRWPRGNGAWEAGISLSDRIETGADGTTLDDPVGRLSAGWSSARFEAAATVDVDRDEGVGVGIAVSAAGSGGTLRAGGEVRCVWERGDPASVSLSGHARLAGATCDVVLRAGVRNLRLAPNVNAEADPWGSLEWRVTDPGGGAHADRGP